MGKFIKGHEGYKHWEGKKFSKEHKEKLSESHKGQEGYWTGKKREMIPKSAFKKGNIPWNKNKPRSEETKRKISESKKGTMTGEKNSFWKGGLSFLPYGPEFNIILKQKIKERDKFTCKLCDDIILEQAKNKFLTVHHIDYNKMNNKLDNLISLCNFCNSSVNKDREDWTKHFQEKMRGDDLLVC